MWHHADHWAATNGLREPAVPLSWRKQWNRYSRREGGREFQVQSIPSLLFCKMLTSLSCPEDGVAGSSKLKAASSNTGWCHFPQDRNVHSPHWHNLHSHLHQHQTDTHINTKFGYNDLISEQHLAISHCQIAVSRYFNSCSYSCKILTHLQTRSAWWQQCLALLSPQVGVQTSEHLK
jgi:hypothetical protein